MLTEDDARRLLQQAGETIDIPPTSRPVPSRPRRWPALVAAAAVLAVLAGGAWLVRPLTDGPGPDDGAEVSVADGTPAGTVPSVFGHTRESATDLLRSRGLSVVVEPQTDCAPEGRAIETLPATGSPVEPGDTVTLFVAFQGPTTDCVMDFTESWAFLDFATGHGPAPAFAETVTLVVDDGPPRTISGAAAADATAWGDPSALGELRAAAAQVVRVDDEYLTPELSVRQGTPPDRLCGVRRPEVTADREALVLAVDVPVDGILHCPATVALYRTDGRIDTVVTWTEKPIGEAAAVEPVPDVVGLPLVEARDAVTDAGFTARVEELETCDPRTGVVEQAPTQQDVEDDVADDPSPVRVVTLVVEVPHTTRDCAALAEAAAGFLRFARGGEPPAWAPQVRLLLGFEQQGTITGAQADDPESWALCAGVEPARCPLSAVDAAGDGDAVAVESVSDLGSPAADVPPSDCLIDLGGLPLDLVEEQSIALGPRDAGDCLAWVVELWIDDTGAIAAANLRVPSD